MSSFLGSDSFLQEVLSGSMAAHKTSRRISLPSLQEQLHKGWSGALSFGSNWIFTPCFVELQSSRFRL